MSGDLATFAIAAGRVLLGALFVVGGARHFFLMGSITARMAARGVPYPREVLIVGSVWEAIFGAMLALGLLVPVAAPALIAFTVAATVMLVNFWDKQGVEREMTFNGFMSNVAVCGGLLIAAATA